MELDLWMVGFDGRGDDDFSPIAAVHGQSTEEGIAETFRRQWDTPRQYLIMQLSPETMPNKC